MNQALLEEGYARAEEVTRRHARTFAFSSVVLFGQRRRAAFALYAFCRHLDDLVDGDNRGDGRVAAPAAPADEIRARLATARAAVAAAYGEARTGLAALPWHESEFAAFQDTVQRFKIPQAPFQDLIDGMEMDLSGSRYPTFEALRLYCHRVAGVVGLMMTPVLGYRDERCLPHADELGIALQLTNILRDVREDLHRDRVYLPQDELRYFGLTEADLKAGCVDERWRGLMRFQVARARAYAARGQLGVPDLQGFGSQRVTRLIGTIYTDILTTIEANGYDVFATRAHVSTGRKVRLLLQVLLTPTPAAFGPIELPRLPAPAPEVAT
jgi:15-cis-phytoene synthase